MWRKQMNYKERIPQKDQSNKVKLTRLEAFNFNLPNFKSLNFTGKWGIRNFFPVVFNFENMRPRFIGGEEGFKAFRSLVHFGLKVPSFRVLYCDFTCGFWCKPVWFGWCCNQDLNVSFLTHCHCWTKQIYGLKRISKLKKGVPNRKTFYAIFKYLVITKKRFDLSSEFQASINNLLHSNFITSIYINHIYFRLLLPLTYYFHFTLWEIQIFLWKIIFNRNPTENT